MLAHRHLRLAEALQGTCTRDAPLNTNPPATSPSPSAHGFWLRPSSDGPVTAWSRPAGLCELLRPPPTVPARRARAGPPCRPPHGHALAPCPVLRRLLGQPDDGDTFDVFFEHCRPRSVRSSPHVRRCPRPWFWSPCPAPLVLASRYHDPIQGVCFRSLSGSQPPRPAPGGLLTAGRCCEAALILPGSSTPASA